MQLVSVTMLSSAVKRLLNSVKICTAYNLQYDEQELLTAAVRGMYRDSVCILHACRSLQEVSYSIATVMATDACVICVHEMYNWKLMFVEQTYVGVELIYVSIYNVNI